MCKIKRLEAEITSDLTVLCSKSGYIHAIAYYCLIQGPLHYLCEQYCPYYLVRNEIDALLGLMIKCKFDWELPKQQQLHKYIEETKELLKELHDCIQQKSRFIEKMKNGLNLYNDGESLREPMFYFGESAYHFQYLDFAERRYADDKSWLQNHYGFSIAQASQVARSINSIINNKLKIYPTDVISESTSLPLFTCSAEDISSATKLEINIVNKILDAFILSPEDRNVEFITSTDSNAITATPLLRMPKTKKIVSLSSSTLAEAIYKSPFYWMAKDKSYFSTLTKNRGKFTENFVFERLVRVFGDKNVYSNVNIYKTKSDTISEIDVLVVWGDRVIIAQTKSKGLNLESRKGNDQFINNDFKKAIQSAALLINHSNFS